jgi:copper transport protein
MELPRSRGILWIGWWWLLAGTLAWFLLQGPYVIRGSLGDVVDPGLWSDVAGTRLGRLLLVRLALVLVAGLMLVWHRASGSTAWRTIGLLLGLGLVLSHSASGHPSVDAPAAYGVALDAVHLTSVSVWIGGLVMLLGGGRSWFADPVVDHGEAVEPHPVRRFSRWALVAVVLIVATGVAQTVHLAGGLGDLTESNWGRLLLVKVALVVVLVTLGAVSRWLLRHEGPTNLRRGVVTEAVIAVIVIGVTAALVGTPPTTETSVGSFSATLVQSGVIADVTVAPARTGTNELHLVFTTPGGTLQAVQGAEARMLLPSRDIPAVDVELTAIGPNHWTGIVQLPFEGDWTLEVIVRPDATQQVLLSTTVPVDS